jgi:hypothetical protein
VAPISVTPGGDLVRADADHEPDLFWAVRGGGVGVVTALEMRLYPIGELCAGDLFFPVQRRGGPARLARMDGSSPGRCHLHLPHPAAAAAARAPEPLRGRAFAIIEAACLGDAGTGAELIGPLRRLGPERDTFAMIPASALGQLNMDPGQPVPGEGDGAFLADFPAVAIDTLVAVAGPDAQTPPDSVEVRHLGGALTRPFPGGGAQPSIDASYLLYAADATPTPGQAALVPWHASYDYYNFEDTPGPGCRGAPAPLLPPPARDQSRLPPRPGDHLRPPRLADPTPTCRAGARTAMSRGNLGDGRIIGLLVEQPWPPRDDTGGPKAAWRPVRLTTQPGMCPGDRRAHEGHQSEGIPVIRRTRAGPPQARSQLPDPQVSRLRAR